MNTFVFSLSLLMLTVSTLLQPSRLAKPGSPDVKAFKAEMKTGAEQLEKYTAYLKGKRVGMLANQTTVIGKMHLVDYLKKQNVNLVTIFGPEHGFRGNASNGARVNDEVDSATGIPIVSLYGAKRKPAKKDMDAIDIMVFDIQDVGCRFYTNINTLYDVMEACAENNKELVILDRPNPNGYVDGPVLDMMYKSGIGKFPIPITHGMTIGSLQKWSMEKNGCLVKSNAGLRSFR